MNRDEIIKLAREVGGSVLEPYDYGAKPRALIMRYEVLERFAALVAAAEREAIARKFDGPVWSYDYREIAAAIRARGVASA